MGKLKMQLQTALSRHTKAVSPTDTGERERDRGTNWGGCHLQLEGGGQLVECVKALALCHNVTPVLEQTGEEGVQAGDQNTVNVQGEEVVIFQKCGVTPRRISYQASSPDEVGV